MNDQLSTAFSAAGEEAARRIRAKREAKERPKANTKANGELFAAAMQAKLDQQSHDTEAIFGYNI